MAITFNFSGLIIFGLLSICHHVIIAGIPLNEPVAKVGPFVMNTKQEIYKAFADYKSVNLA